MLDIVMLIIFIVMSFRIIKSVIDKAALYREFQLSRSLAVLALLFPVGPLCLLLLSSTSLILATIVAACCYLPALIVARHQHNILDRTGTSRIKPLMDTTSQAFGTALAGLVYISVAVGLGLLIGWYHAKA